jgi:triosephosphate isomerase
VKTLIVGNWKMNKTVAAATAFVHELLAMHPDLSAADAVVAPPFTALPAVAHAFDGSEIGIGAQTMHWAPAGAYTGEVSAPMLVELGVRWVILGHSERREAAAESDESVNRKVIAALAAGLIPIVAVGETLEEHAAGLASERVCAQTRGAFDGISAADVATCVVAYEPIWAIGSGKIDHPAEANATMGAIRGAVDGLAHARILYGGSVKPDNIGALVAQPNIDGALVGGASLDPASFAALLRNARKGAPA